MKNLSLLLLSAALLLLPSCISVRVGPDDDFLEVKGLANAYGTVNGLDDWDGTLFELGLFSNNKGRDEILSVELGPLAAVGVGLLGARVRVLPFEVGVGTLFYNPRPRKRSRQVEVIESEEYDDFGEHGAEGVIIDIDEDTDDAKGVVVGLDDVTNETGVESTQEPETASKPTGKGNKEN